MTERVQKQLALLKGREYRKERRTIPGDITPLLKGKTELEKEVIRFTYLLEQETPRIFEGDRIGFQRTVANYPYEADEQGHRRKEWSPGNITPDYARILKTGLDDALAQAESYLDGEHPAAGAICDTIRAALAFADRYREFARKQGNSQLAQALAQVPHGPATSYYEACVFLKFIQYTLRCNRNEHVTFGRFDQYMYPYFQRDLERGVTREELLELTEEFFISINFDTDIYSGIQQGDNGQSMVLGGRDEKGTDQFNELSQLVMEASLELSLIDPKINLRVDKNTPFDRYLLGSRLTAKGLGFPQYSNDDVVIDGLIALGYEPKDAADYAVAACWEFIIPGCGMDYPNIGVMNFPKIVREAVCQHLTSCDTYEDLWAQVARHIKEECDRLVETCNRVELGCSPYLSVYVRGCGDRGRDISENAAKYNNSGCHGAGISNAADALAAIKQAVYTTGEAGREELLKAMERDFKGEEPLRHKLLSCPKMGNNLDEADQIACDLMEAYSQNLNGRKNNRGGIFRAGTGSAMEYIWSSQNVGATSDGRNAGAPYGSSFSPSLTAHTEGVLSVIQSFTKYDMKKIINGGPLTIELHSSVFRNPEGVEKTALLVREFVRRGGHQLQLNSINREVLLDAQKHPENHQDLIVRVWGWSGYFNELAPEYQEHVIKRAEFSV